MEYAKLYKRTSVGKIQVWWAEIEHAKYRTYSGQEDGAITVSAWTETYAKNVGRANYKSPEQQVVIEVEALYEKKINQGKYKNDRRAVDTKPSFFSPMLAHKFDPARIDDAFYIQPKLNGCRCIADARGLWSRNGKEFVNTPHIHEALKEFFEANPDAILDGELYNHDYNEKFQTLISAIKKGKPTVVSIEGSRNIVQYHIYDFPSAGGTFEERWNALEALFNTSTLQESQTIQLCPTWRSNDVKTAQGLHERNKAKGYEGSIIRLNAKYENKRTHSLMKYKDFLDAEFEIKDVLEGKGNWAGHAKTVELWLDKLKTGYFGAGFLGDKTTAYHFLRKKADYIGKLGTVVYQELSEYGVPIFPIFHGIRDYE